MLRKVATNDNVEKAPTGTTHWLLKIIMIPFTAQYLLVCGYVILLGVILLERSGYSAFGLLEKRQDYFHNSHAIMLSSRQDLGVSGPALYELFEKHLLDAYRIPGRYPGGISTLYDTFSEYVFKGTSRGNCSVERSAVAKLTRDVTPLPIHSHNDYWRDVPLLKGLAYGSVSTEADVWVHPHKDHPYNSTTDKLEDYVLAVGHDEDYIDPLRKTLEKLYTDPLQSLLEGVNCGKSNNSKTQKNGVFYTANHIALFFYIDFKSDDNVLTYKLLLEKYFTQLIQAGYLTYYDMDTGKIIQGQVTVIMTGNYPNNTDVLDNGKADGYFGDRKRYLLQDANLLELNEESAKMAVTASTSLSEILKMVGSSNLKVIMRGHLDKEEITAIKKYIDNAHSFDLKTRIWGVPSWPRKTMKRLWKQQIEDLNSDFLNVDDLKAAAMF
ncbi:Hypothetical protein J6897_00657 [Nakaseomyces glabratus]